MRKQPKWSARVISAAALLAAGPALAQIGEAPRQPQDPGPTAPQGPQAGPDDTPAAAGGVIRPPDVDPKMTRPAPDIGTTPIIPPPAPGQPTPR